MNTEQIEDTATSGQSELTDGLVVHIARFMSYAYQRGKLDASGFPDCKEKEDAIKKIGDIEAERWIASAKALLLDMNWYDC